MVFHQTTRDLSFRNHAYRYLSKWYSFKLGNYNKYETKKLEKHLLSKADHFPPWISILIDFSEFWILFHPMIHSLSMSFSQIRSHHIIPLLEIFHQLLLVLNNKNLKHKTREGSIVHVYLTSSLCIMFSFVLCVRTTFFQLLKLTRLASCHRSFKYTHSSLYLVRSSFPPHKLDLCGFDSFFGLLSQVMLFGGTSDEVRYPYYTLEQHQVPFLCNTTGGE